MNKKLTAENRKEYRGEPQRNMTICSFAALCAYSAHFAFKPFSIQILYLNDIELRLTNYE
jgi:hypothetical protein